MKLKEVIDKDYGIVVNDKPEYDKLAKILDEAGLRWKDGDSYIEHSCSMYNLPFYISPNQGAFGQLTYVGKSGSVSHTIPLSDLDEAKEETELELDRLRNRVKELEAQLAQQQPKDEWPKELDECWYSTMDGDVDILFFNCTNNEHNKRLSIGNVHRTKEEAEAWFERKQLEHKMNEGGRVQVYLFNNAWCFVAADFPTHGFFSSTKSAQAFLSDPENIKLLNKHFK